MHVVCEPSILYFGTPVALLSTKNEDGTDNLSPMSSIFWLGWRCVIGLGSSNKTTQNLIRTKECVVNLPSINQVAAVDRLALTTGSNPVPANKQRKGYVYEPDKFFAAGLTPEPSHFIKPSRVKECPVHMESEVVAAYPLGLDDAALARRITIFEMKILRVHIDAALLIADNGDKVDPDKWRPLMMSFQKFYGLGSQLHHSALAKIPEKMYEMK